MVFGRHLAIFGIYILAKTIPLNGDEHLTLTVLNLQESFKNKRDHVQCYQPTSPEIQVHDLQPGGTVLIKVPSHKSKLKPRWEWLYTLLRPYCFYRCKSSRRGTTPGEESRRSTTHMLNSYWRIIQWMSNDQRRKNLPQPLF